MTIDDTPLAERTFTETHDRILHALVEQVHDMGLRIAALEAANSSPEANVVQRRDTAPIAPPAVPTAAQNPAHGHHDSSPRGGSGRPIDQSSSKTRSGRTTGWQPTRR